MALRAALLMKEMGVSVTRRRRSCLAPLILAQLGVLEMEQAFAVLRRYARDHHMRLTEPPPPWPGVAFSPRACSRSRARPRPDQGRPRLTPAFPWAR